jgi:RNA polymerase sigma factor (sigma-70 family)
LTTRFDTDRDNQFLAWWLETEPTLLRFARSYGLSAGEAHDVLADVVVLALSKRPDFATVEDFKRWALARVRWRILDEMRLARKVITLPSELLPEAYSRKNEQQEFEDREERRRVACVLHDAVARLPSHQRAVIEGDAAGKTSDVIAAQLGVTQATVRSLRRFARRRLAALLTDLEPHYD